MKRIMWMLSILLLAAVFSLSADAPLTRPWVDAPPQRATALINFVNAQNCAGVKPGKKVQAEFSAADRKLKVTFPGKVKFPSITLWQAAAPQDLSKAEFIRVLMTNPNAGRITLWFRVYDSSDIKEGAEYGVPVDPGTETAVLPLANMIRKKNGIAIDTTKISRIDVAMDPRGEAAVILFESIETARVFGKIKGLRAFDFGEGSAFPGMVGVTAQSAYTPERGWGLTSTEGFAGKQRKYQFGISGDGLNGNSSFAVDLENGTYEVQVIGYGINWQSIRNHGYSIDAEGANAISVEINQDNYYTTKHFLYGYDRIFDPERPVYDQYFKEYFAPHVFEVEVTDGQLNLNFKDMMVCGAWLYPADTKKEAGKVVDGFREEEAYLFAKRGMHVVFDTEPEKECGTAADKDRGYVLFARDFQYRVYPDYVPETEELLADIEAWAAPGEYEPITFCIRPLADLKDITVTVSDLASANGAAIPASAIEIGLAKQIMFSVAGNKHKPTPHLVVPAVPVSAPTNYNRQFWLTLHVPDKAAAGEYKGEVRIACQGGQGTALPLTVNVYPFKLEKAGVSMGVWDNNINKQDVAFQWEGRNDYIRKAVRNQLQDMMAHGIDAMTLPSPSVTDVQPDGSIKVDWSHLDIWAEEIMQTPMKDSEQIMSILGIINYRFMRRGLKEFGPEFEKALKALLDELMVWKAKHGIKILLQVVDEPREYNINDWNRNRKDTIWYLKTIRKMVPDLRLMVDPMGDNDYYGDSYLPMIPLMDVCMTHSTPGSRQTIFLTRDEGLAEYIQYNNGMGRFTYGFFIWKDKSLGHWQWVYSWVMGDQHVPFFCNLGSDAVGAGPDATVLPTLRYEAVREGVDDLRYMRTLEAALQTADAENAVAKEARKFLKVLDLFLPQYPKHLQGQSGESAGTKYTEDAAKAWYGQWRRQIAQYIIALQANTAAVKLEGAWSMFPSGMTRDKKTAECVILKPGKEVPVIDGEFNDTAWKGVPVQSYFMNLARNKPAETQTEVRMVTDGKKLYLAFKCAEPNVAQLVADYMERDSGQWQDDSVEIFIDTNMDKDTYYQIIVNYLGGVQDGDKGTGSLGGVWDADIEVKTKKLRTEWVAEMAISLKSLGSPAVVAGSTWGLNLCRNRKPPLSETSSWTFVGASFHNPSGFGTLEFIEDKK
ncbi:glycoside hydrolase domain-containing protein [Planctomycetota bacterium]